MLIAKRIFKSPVSVPLLALIIISLVIGSTTEVFWQFDNMRNIILQVGIVSIMSVGATFVILTGGIDLSPGSAMCLLTMILASTVKLQGLPTIVGVLIVLAMGIVLGLFNGIVTAYLRIPAFITTLAALSIFRGLAFMINDGAPVYSISPGLQQSFYGSFLGLPLVLYYVLIVYMLAEVLLKYTEIGRQIYAVGGNAKAARFSGINVKRVIVFSFVIAGFTTAIASVLMGARLNSGSPNYGVGMELSAIAASVIGGASLAGGKADVKATLIGSLTIVVIQNGLNLHAVPASLQSVITGFIIIFAVLMDMWRLEVGALFAKITSGMRKSTEV